MIVLNRHTNIVEFIDSINFNEEDYVNINTPANYSKYWKDIGIDYMRARLEVQQLVLAAPNGFNDFKTDDKYSIGEFVAIDDATTLIAFYIEQGYSATEAKGLHLQRLSFNHVNERSSAEIRANSEVVTSIIIKYLTWQNGDGSINRLQADNFISATREFISDYKTEAILGTFYGDVVDGIMDYIESTGSYTSGGMKNYSFNPEINTAYGGDTELVRQAFISEFKDVFVNGNY